MENDTNLNTPNEDSFESSFKKVADVIHPIANSFYKFMIVAILAHLCQFNNTLLYLFIYFICVLTEMKNFK